MTEHDQAVLRLKEQESDILEVFAWKTNFQAGLRATCFHTLCIRPFLHIRNALPLPQHLERQDKSLDKETVKYGFFSPLHLQGPEVRTIIFANTAEACLSFEMVPRSHSLTQKILEHCT